MVQKPTDKTLSQPVDGSRINLNNPNLAWLVSRGKVDLFFTWCENGNNSRLFPLARIEQGSLILGMDLSPWEGRLGLVGIGVAGTEIPVLRRNSSTKETNQAETVSDQAYATLVEGWVETLTQARKNIPKKHQKVSKLGEISLEKDLVLLAQNQPLWLENLSADLSSTFEIRRDNPQNGFMLLTRSHWAKVNGQGKGTVFDTINLISNDRLDDALTVFHEQVANDLVTRCELMEEKETQRLEHRIRSDEHILERALGEFASVLGAQKHGSISPTEPSDRLYAVVELVASAGGIKLNPDAADRYNGSEFPLNAILRASSVRCRSVILADQWWHQDNGPLLGMTRENATPVALLPRSPRRYDLFNANGTCLEITESVAETLQDQAFILYRPLPERSLTKRDLLAYASFGTGRDFVMIALMSALGAMLGLVFPIAIGTIYDQVIPMANYFDLGFIALALFTASIAMAMFECTKGIALVRFEGRIDSQVQAAVWDRILSLSVPFFKRYSSGDLTERAMGIERIRGALSGFMILSLISSIFSSFYFFLLLYYSFSMAMVALGLVVLTLFPLALGIYKVGLERKIQAVDGKLSGLLLQLLLGIAKLRMAGAEERAFARWATPFAQSRRLKYKAGMVESFVGTWNTAFTVGSMIVIFAAYMHFGMSGEPGTSMTVGRFIAFNGAFTLFLLGVMSLSDILVKVLALVPLYERAMPIFEAQPEALEALTQPGELSGGLEVGSLSFRYEGSEALVLNKVSFSVDAGQFVAVVGPSGSGKSTLLRLLLGFEKPLAGAVYFDGLELAGLDIREVRRQIGVVLQNSHLVPGSIYDNIVGSLPLSLDDAWAAAEAVGFAADIRAMPMGMHTVISESGGTFSGGQVQRLLIARALVNKPRMLFFDEATSALDNQTQAVVTASLNKLRVTRMVIAHRLSTVIGADKILVMDAGKIVETGTYDELMALGGTFFRLANRQLA